MVYLLLVAFPALIVLIAMLKPRVRVLWLLCIVPVAMLALAWYVAKNS